MDPAAVEVGMRNIFGVYQALKQALHGLRVAPQKFHDWLAKLFLSIGFRQMVGNFRHDEKGGVENVIHIDDGIIAGRPVQVTEIKQILQGKVAMKDLGSIDKHRDRP